MKLLTLFAAIALASQASAAELKTPRDGWVSWEVPAVDDAPFFCCWSSWSDRRDMRKTCKLDEHQGFGTRDDRGSTDVVKVYARFKDGRLEKVQALAAACPAETNTQVEELANVNADDSARWLVARIRQHDAGPSRRESMLDQLLSALSVHHGVLAGNELASFARQDPRVETRKKAVFWLAMVRGIEGAEITASLMFNDPDAEFREHAAFALSQSKSPRIAADLIRLGNTDKVGEVRGQAWFWLAQTGADRAEEAIITAMRKDADDNVREKAVFALSQLPAERATRALIAAAEDQSLSRDQRKKAVFWLSQSDADSAQAYLEKVLARTVVK